MPFGNARTQGFNTPSILNFNIDNVAINPNGIFIYSVPLPPTANNLIESIVFGTSNVTDSAGNVALPGTTTYVQDGSTYQALNIYEGLINWYSATTEAGPWTVGSGIDGRANEFNIGNGAGTVQIETEDLAGAYANGGFVVNFPTQTGLSGIAAVPTGILQLVTHAPETWHTMTLQNSWANTAGSVASKYRFVASPPNSVEIIGTLAGTAATAAQFFQLPAGPPSYRPVSAQRFAVGGAAGSAGAPEVACDTSGNLSMTGIPALPVADNWFIHGFISLDA